MIGIICEKPSAKRNFATALGGDKGKYKGQEYLIVNLRGHLYQYVEPAKQVHKDLEKTYASWALSELPWEYKDFNWKREKSKIKGTSALIKDIKTQLSKCSEIVIATDYDAISGEGFLLAAELLIETGLINKKNTKFSRMIFLDETPATIRKAFEDRIELKDMYEYPEYRKSLFRSQWDFMSQQFTRVANAFAPSKLGIPRQGRLKSYIVYEVGKAWEEVDNHVDKKFFQNRFIDENNNQYIDNKETKYDTREEVPAENFKKSTVTIESEIIKNSPPPKMYDMAKLSAYLTTQGYTVNQIKNTYQSMYEASVLSYPRTSDSTITLEQFNELLPLVDSIAKLVDVDTKLLTYRKPRKTHIKEGGSHGANRPGVNVPKTMTEIKNKWGVLGTKIYSILARSFLSLLAPNYEYLQQKGFVTDYPTFKATANIPKFEGWKAVLSNLDISEQDDSSIGLGKSAEPIVFEGEYPKPQKPTFMWLTKQMDKYDVGTGSTRASTIGDISVAKSKNSLLENNRGQLSLTLLGKISYDLIKGTNIASVKLTEQIMKVMENIGTEDEVNPTSIINEMERLVMEDMEIMKENRNKSVTEYYKNKENGKDNKSQYPTVDKISFTDEDGNELKFKSEWNGRKFTEEEIEKLKNGEEIKIGPFKNKKGGNYWAIGQLEWQDYKGHKFFGFKVSEFANN